MQFHWKTALIFFSAGLLVGSFYANVVFTRSEKHNSRAKKIAEIVHHAGLSGHDGLLNIQPEPGGGGGDNTPIEVDGQSQSKLQPIRGQRQPIPIWLWMDYDKLPGFVELNLRILEHNAPAPLFKMNFVTPSTIRKFIPDMPEEFDRMPYAAATSDLIRTGLIAHHGGVYMDTDFLVQHPLHEFTDLLATADFVSYESHGQDCQKGQFSSNFVAGKKANALYRESWDEIKRKLKQRCLHKDGDGKQGVCCYKADGSPRKCHIPWAGVGERTSHPILKRLLADPASNFKIVCYNSSRSFVPPLKAHNNPKSVGFDSGHIAWVEIDGSVCNRVGDDLICRGNLPDGKRWTGESKTYFGRLAYHLFASGGANEGNNRALSPEQLLNGRLAISELYRGALKGHPPPPLAAELSHIPKMYSISNSAKIINAQRLIAPAAAPIRPPLTEDGRCTATYSKWAGQNTINKSDDFQCRPLDVTFVHIPKTVGTTIEGIARKRLGVTWGHDYDMKRWDQLKTLTRDDPSGTLAKSYPRVGTTSATQIKVCSGTCPCHQGCCWWHVPPQFVLDWRPYYVAPWRFCVVRNPFKRMLSQYSYSGVYDCPDTPEKLRKRDAYLVKHLLEFRKGNHWAADCHFIPQHWYIQNDINKVSMNRLLDPSVTPEAALRQVHASQPPKDSAESWQCNVVLRFENMTQDLAAFSSWTGVNVTVPYKRPYTSRCTTALAKETVELIREIYAEDFERYGYSQDWETYD